MPAGNRASDIAQRHSFIACASLGAQGRRDAGGNGSDHDPRGRAGSFDLVNLELAGRLNGFARVAEQQFKAIALGREPRPALAAGDVFKGDLQVIEFVVQVIDVFERQNIRANLDSDVPPGVGQDPGRCADGGGGTASMAAGP